MGQLNYLEYLFGV